MAYRDPITEVRRRLNIGQGFAAGIEGLMNVVNNVVEGKQQSDAEKRRNELWLKRYELDKASNAELERLKAEWRKRLSEQDFYQKWILKLIDANREAKEQAKKDMDNMPRLNRIPTLNDTLDKRLSDLKPYMTKEQIKQLESEGGISLEDIITTKGGDGKLQTKALALYLDDLQAEVGGRGGITAIHPEVAQEVRRKVDTVVAKLNPYISGEQYAATSETDRNLIEKYVNLFAEPNTVALINSPSGFIGQYNSLSNQRKLELAAAPKSEEQVPGLFGKIVGWGKEVITGKPSGESQAVERIKQSGVGMKGENFVIKFPYTIPTDKEGIALGQGRTVDLSLTLSPKEYAAWGKYFNPKEPGGYENAKRLDMINKYRQLKEKKQNNILFTNEEKMEWDRVRNALGSDYTRTWMPAAKEAIKRAYARGGDAYEAVQLEGYDPDLFIDLGVSE